MLAIINLGIIFRVISRNMYILAVSLALCMGVALIFHESVVPFLMSGLVAGAIGLLAQVMKRKQEEELPFQGKEAYLIVTISWLLLSLVGALPYLISGAIPGFVDALFESVSGFTTTGSSILTDIEVLPKSILFWRSLTHWIGGIGIIVLVIIVMPRLQIGGHHLFTLESSMQEKIKPKIKSVGKSLLKIYVGLTVAEIGFLLLGGMNLYESVCHAFGTVATGGFSPLNSSIAGYSPYIQYVIMVFMLLAGTNFIVHYYLLRRDFKRVGANEELKFYLFMVFVIGTLITWVLFRKTGLGLEAAFREAFFQVISIITCTGFASADYMQWPVFGWTLLFISMFLGGSTGSTAGGIKMGRHLAVYKNLKRYVAQLASPNAVLPLRINGNLVSDSANRSILTFVWLYFVVFAIGSLVMVILGVDGASASSSVATCMAGIGPGIGKVGPAHNFSHLPDAGKLVLSFIMLVGRLEIYTIVILFTRNFWRK
ncbi:MAG: TrkH family potassium uptake protein [Bacteroidales bacterium]